MTNIGSRSTEKHGKIRWISKAGYNVRHCPYTKGTAKLYIHERTAYALRHSHAAHD